jgi:hypothetical protein
MTLSIINLIVTLNIIDLIVTISIKEIQHDDPQRCYADCHHAE